MVRPQKYDDACDGNDLVRLYTKVSSGQSLISVRFMPIILFRCSSKDTAFPSQSWMTYIDGSLNAFAIDLKSLSVNPVNPRVPGGGAAGM